MTTTQPAADAPAAGWEARVEDAQRNSDYRALASELRLNIAFPHVLAACCQTMFAMVVEGASSQKAWCIAQGDAAIAAAVMAAFGAGAVDAVVRACMTHPADAAVQIETWMLLTAFLCYLEESHKIALAKVASKLAADALVPHRDDAKVLKYVCIWLSACAKDDALKSMTTALVRDGIFVRLAGVLGAHSMDTELLAVVLEAVCYFCPACGWCTAVGAELAALGALEALQCHLHNAKVQEKAIVALGFFWQLEGSPLQLRLVAAGIMEALRSSLHELTTAGGNVQPALTRVLPFLVQLIGRFARALRALSRKLPFVTCSMLMHQIVEAWGQHAANAQMAGVCCATLLALNEFCADGGATLRRAGATPLLDAARAAFPEDAEVQACHLAAMDVAAASAAADAAMAALLAEEEAERAGKAVQASKRKKKKQSKKKRGGASSAQDTGGAAAGAASSDDDDDSVGAAAAAPAALPTAAPAIEAPEAAAPLLPPPPPPTAAADVPPPPPPRRVPPPYRPPVGGSSPLAPPAPTPSILLPPLPQQCAPLQPPSLAALSLASTASAAAAAPPQPPPEMRECCVCLADVPRADLLQLLPCAHRCVCQTCADELIAQRRACPKCREPIARASRVFED